MHKHLEVIMAVAPWLGLAAAFAQETGAGASVYHLWTFGTARNELRALTLTP